MSRGTTSATGSCQLTEPVGGTYTLTASYAGHGAFAAPASSGTTITIADRLPVFQAADPPLATTPDTDYGYTFTATGDPRYALAPGAPRWLHINPVTGAVSGAVPLFTTSFRYGVTATNDVGTTVAGPFTVKVSVTAVRADLSAHLRCRPR